MNISVGTKNPAKLKAVEGAFKQFFPREDIVVNGFGVSSSVAEQPRTDQECIDGAQNRANAALKKDEGVDYSVGIESGITVTGGKSYNFAWIEILKVANKQWGSASTARIEVPSRILEVVDGGADLGAAMHQIYSEEDLGKRQGYFGFFTKNIITRDSATSDAIVSALSILEAKDE